MKLQKGFTLIEVAIITAIVGVLTAVAIPSYLNYTIRSKMSDVVLNCGTQMQVMASTVKANSGFFPGGLAGSNISYSELSMIDKIVNTCAESKYVGGDRVSYAAGSFSGLATFRSGNIAYNTNKDFARMVVKINPSVAPNRPSGAATESISSTVSDPSRNTILFAVIEQGSGVDDGGPEMFCGRAADRELPGNTTTIAAKYLPSRCR